MELGKEKQTASPREIEMPRPDLYLSVIIDGGEITGVGEGLWLRKAGGAVKVKVGSNPTLRHTPVGTFDPMHPLGPKYTGPIDDETMANILIYG